MLELVDIEATEVQRGVVACALYRNGRRERDVAVEEIGALAGAMAASSGSVCTSRMRPCSASLKPSSAFTS